MPKNVTERIIDRDFRIRKVGSAVISSIGSYPFGGTGDNDGVDNNGNGNNDTSNTPVPIVVTVSPDTPLSASGYVGGTFSGSVIYTVTNSGTGSVTVSILKSADWITLSTTSLTIAASDSDTVTVSIDGTVAATKARGEYMDVILFNASNTTSTATVASRVAQLSVAGLGIEDYIEYVSAPQDGSGGTLSFTLPNVNDGDQVVIVSRIEGIALTFTDTNSFSNTTGGIYDYWQSDAPPSGTTGVTLVTLMRYAAATDSGDSFNVAISDGGAPYAGNWTNVIIVLKANPLANYVDFYNGVQWEPGGYQSMELDITHSNSFVLFAAVGYSNGSFGFNTFPTAISESSDMYVGAKVYENPISYGITDITAITSVPCFVAEAIWMYSLTATS